MFFSRVFLALERNSVDINVTFLHLQYKTPQNYMILFSDAVNEPTLRLKKEEKQAAKLVCLIKHRLQEIN